MDSIVLVITTALISGLLATIVTLIWQKKSATYNRKMKVFETLMSYRYMISAEESVKTLNSVDVVFYKHANVRKAYQDFLDEAEKKPDFKPNIGDKYLKLLEEISLVLKLNGIHWDDIKRVYYPDGLFEKISDEKVLLKSQIQTNMQLLKNNEGQQNTPADNQFAQTIVTQMIPELMKNPESLKLIMEMSKEQKK